MIVDFISGKFLDHSFCYNKDAIELRIHHDIKILTNASNIQIDMIIKDLSEFCQELTTRTFLEAEGGGHFALDL